MLFHRRQNAQVALHSAIVVIGDVILNHLNEFFTARKPSAVVPLPLEDSPEALHRAIIDALGHSGHALFHICFLQFVVERPVGILEASVAVEQGMRIGIGLDSGIQCIEYKRIIIPVTNDVSNNPSVIQIQNCTEVTQS